MQEQYGKKKKSVKLAVQAGGKLREFTSPDRLSAFIEEEKVAWSFLVDLTSKNTSSHEYKIINQIKAHLWTKIFSSLTAVVNAWDDNESNSADIFNSLQEGFNFPFSKTLKGKAILNLPEDDITKAIVLGLACMPNHDATDSTFTGYISLWGSNGRSFPIIHCGYPNMHIVILKAQQILFSIEQARAIEKDKILENITDAYAKLEEEKVKLQDRLDAVAVEAEQNYSTTRDKISGFLNRRLKAYKRRYHSAQEQVRAAKNTYENEVELHASVEYWKAKKVIHETAIILWGRYLRLSLIGTVGGFAFLVLSPKIFALTERIFDFLFSFFVDAPVVLNSQVEEVNNLLWGAIDPVILSLGVVVLSVGSYVIKLTSQQFRTHQHLSLEAEERSTMLKTYLALMNESKLKDAEDRKIALDVLFRPASTGIIQDQGSVMPSDSIIKIMRSKSSS